MIRGKSDMTNRGTVRRAALFGGCSLLVGGILFGDFTSASKPVAAAEGPVTFVKRMARELTRANRSGSAPAFAAAIYKNAHVRAIGRYALGNYRRSLKASDRDSYYNGMVRFIARYAAGESQKYQVVQTRILGPAYRTRSGVMVDTRVSLRDGQTYDVQWLLQKSRGAYRVRDAKVQVLLGDYWMTPFLKDLFEKYISDNGSVRALVVALNR